MLKVLITNKETGVKEEKVITDKEYLQLSNETYLNREIGLNVTKWQIDVLGKPSEDEIPKSNEEYREEAVLKYIQKHLELHDACGHHGTIYENVLADLKREGLWYEDQNNTEEQ
jgi:hypothetical protein